MLSTGLGNENSLTGVRYVDSGDNEHFFRNSFVDEDAVSFAHRHPSFSLAPHNPEVTIAVFVRQMPRISGLLLAANSFRCNILY